MNCARRDFLKAAGLAGMALIARPIFSQDPHLLTAKQRGDLLRDDVARAAKYGFRVVELGAIDLETSESFDWPANIAVIGKGKGLTNWHIPLVQDDGSSMGVNLNGGCLLKSMSIFQHPTGGECMLTGCNQAFAPGVMRWVDLELFCGRWGLYFWSNGVQVEAIGCDIWAGRIAFGQHARTTGTEKILARRCNLHVEADNEKFTKGYAGGAIDERPIGYMQRSGFGKLEDCCVSVSGSKGTFEKSCCGISETWHQGSLPTTRIECHNVASRVELGSLPEGSPAWDIDVRTVPYGNVKQFRGSGSMARGNWRINGQVEQRP